MTDQRDELDQWFDSISYEDSPAPSPRFVRNLRRGLVAQASRMITSARPMPTPAPAGRWLDRRTLLQLAAVLALVIAWVGTLAGGGPREISDRFGGYFQQQEAAAEAPSMYRGNNARTGVVDDSGPAENPHVAWEVTPAEPGFNIVNATDDIILLAYEQGGRLVALDRADGSLRWRYDSACRLEETTPAIIDSVVYLTVSCQGDIASSVIALNEADGNLVWRSDFDVEARTSPLIVDGTLYVMTTDYPPTVIAIDLADGATTWQITIERTDQPGVAVPEEQLFGNMSAFSPAYGEGQLFATTWDGLVHGIDAETGNVNWTFDTGANSISTPAFADGTVYFSFAGITMREGTFGFLALDAKTGSELWRDELPTHAPYSGPIIAGDLVIYSISNAPGDPVTVAWERETGELAWREYLGGTTILADGVLFVLDQRSGYVYALSARSGGYLWRAYIANFEFVDDLNAGARIRSEPVLQDGTLIVASQAERLLAIVPEPTPEASIASPTPMAGYDFTGLPSCETPPPIDWESLEGEPALSLVPTGEDEQYGQPAAMHPNAVPAGDPVSDPVLVEIETAIAEMETCSQRPGQYDGTGFFSEDYFRRVWVRFRMTHNESAAIRNSDVYNASRDNDSTTTFYLADGRVARLTIVQTDPVVFGYLYIFVNNGERWVIDEVIQISETPEGLG